MLHRGGKLFRGSHTTCTEFASQVIDILVEVPGITGISLGYISSGKGSGGGSRRVKIAVTGAALLLTVRQASSIQELRVFTRDTEATQLSIAKALADQDIKVSIRQ